MNNPKYIFAISIFLVIGILIIFSIKSPTPYKEVKVIDTPKTNTYKECDSDKDCISIRADGCGCNAGGKNTSINMKYKSEWEDIHPSMICSEVMSNDPSCIKVAPKCINKVCMLVTNE